MKKDLLIQFFLFLLVSFGVAYIYMFAGETKFQKSIDHAENQIHKIHSVFHELTQREDLDLRSLSFEEFDKFNKNLPFDLFVSKNNHLIFWNENKAVPADLNIQSLTEDAKLVSLKNGYYIALKKTIGDKEFVALSLLRNSYSLVNKYLTNSYSKQYNFHDNDVILPALHSTGVAVNSPSGKAVFRILHQNIEDDSIDKLRLVISFLILILLFFFIQQVGFYLKLKFHCASLGFFVLGILGAVFLSIIKLIPFEFNKLILFNSGLYGSSFFSSLGELSFFIIYIFFLSYYYFIHILKDKIRHSLILSIFSFVLLVSSYLFVIFILKSLVLDSIINYGAKNLTLLNFYGLYGITLALAVCISFVFIGISSIYVLRKNKYLLTVISIASLLVLSVLYYYNFGILSIIFTGIFFVFVFFLYKHIAISNNSNVVVITVVSLLLSVSLVSITTRYYTIDKSVIAKKIIASKKSRQRDITAEDSFIKIESKIIEDEFVKKFFQNPMISYRDIYKRLTSRYFGGYFSKYDISIIPFNINGKSIKYNSKETLKDYYEKINKYGETTISDQLVFIQDKKDDYSYISLLQIVNKDKTVGTLAIKIFPKTYDLGNVYPELLLQGKKDLINQYVDDFEFAIYYDDILISQSPEFSYEIDFENVKQKKYVKDGFNHSIFHIDKHKTIVVSSRKDTIWNILSVFSFILCFYFILGFCVIICYFKLTSRTNRNVFNLSFRKKINSAMLSLVVLSFFIIGFATVRYFSTQYDTYHQKRLIRKEKAISTALKYVIEKKTLNGKKKFKNYFANYLSSDLIEISDIHKMDINIFDTAGSLMTSSQDGIFTSGLLSNIMNPKAFVLLENEKKALVSQEESIGNLNYLSIYVPILSDKDEILGYLNIPYFAKEKNLRKDISNFMIALMNVYVLLLLLASVFAFFVSNSITNPLKSISEKIKEISLTKRNARIEWQEDDEIGGLVKEYNSMISQLDQNATLLAKSERDNAWREMAKQIAHEIKNPLTPMKLSIQHLQKVLKDDPEKGAGLATRVSKTLIEQINNLSDIATAFSSFAKMPKGDKTYIDLIEVVDTSVDLFNSSNILLSKNYIIENAPIFADKNQLISVFNNLIKNAIQATEEKKETIISVEIYLQNSMFCVAIKDNGIGISEEKAEKVFVPNFTTKSSGTGLGLAISKQIIENLDGEIYFYSKEKEYTIFYVKIPINEFNEQQEHF